MKPLKSPIQVLCEHAARTLPDSIQARSLLLAAMAKVLQPKSAAHRNVTGQMASLTAATQLEIELPPAFATTTATGSHHDAKEAA